MPRFRPRTVHTARLKTWENHFGRTLSEVGCREGMRKAVFVVSSRSACARVAVLVANGRVWRRRWGFRIRPDAILDGIDWLIRLECRIKIRGTE